MADTDVRQNFEVSENINNELNHAIPFGMKSDVFRALTDIFLESVGSHPPRSLLLALLDGKVELVVKAKY